MAAAATAAAEEEGKSELNERGHSGRYIKNFRTYSIAFLFVYPLLNNSLFINIHILSNKESFDRLGERVRERERR